MVSSQGRVRRANTTAATIPGSRADHHLTDGLTFAVAPTASEHDELVGNRLQDFIDHGNDQGAIMTASNNAARNNAEPVG